jgi:hypothetical protein
MKWAAVFNHMLLTMIFSLTLGPEMEQATMHRNLWNYEPKSIFLPLKLFQLDILPQQQKVWLAQYHNILKKLNSKNGILKTNWWCQHGWNAILQARVHALNHWPIYDSVFPLARIHGSWEPRFEEQKGKGTIVQDNCSQVCGQTEEPYRFLGSSWNHGGGFSESWELWQLPSKLLRAVALIVISGEMFGGTFLIFEGWLLTYILNLSYLVNKEWFLFSDPVTTYTGILNFTRFPNHVPTYYAVEHLGFLFYKLTIVLSICPFFCLVGKMVSFICQFVYVIISSFLIKY